MAAPNVSSAWAPLRNAIFRALWLATLGSNLGTWMQSVAAAWLMTSLTSSPFVIAMVQAASTLPVFLFGLAAGAMADSVNRRRLLLITQACMCAAACALSAAAFRHVISAPLLLALTFVIGLGSAMSGPAWQAIVSELVPKEQILLAVSLNSAGFNLARAAGPAIAGLILARTGPSVIFSAQRIVVCGSVVRPVSMARSLSSEHFARRAFERSDARRSSLFMERTESPTSARANCSVRDPSERLMGSATARCESRSRR